MALAQPDKSTIKRVKTCVFTAPIGIPNDAEVYLGTGGVATSSVPFVVNKNVKLRSMAVGVNIADDSRNYDIDMLVNGALTDTITLLSGQSKMVMSSFTTTMGLLDEIKIKAKRSSGVGDSSFNQLSLVLELEER